MWFWTMMSLVFAQVDLNQATVADFDAIPNIDQTMAVAIVDYRNQKGQLSSVESLRVLNLPESSLDSLRDETMVSLTVSKRSGGQYSSVDQVLSQFDGEPDIRAVQAMAMRYSKTNPELMEQWLNSSKRAYALPKVNLQYEKKLDASTRFDYVENIDDPNNPSAQADYYQVGNDDKVVVKLEWRLDKLVMSSEQIRVINESGKANKLRENILDEVTRLYFDRRRLQVESLLEPPSSLQDQIELALRLQEMTANLDALTGGEFTANSQ